jgi:hypothetical protein
LFIWTQKAVFKSVSPVASFFLLLRQKKETKEKATPDRSKARNKIDSLRRLRNSQFASVELLKQGAGLKPQTINFKAARFTGAAERIDCTTQFLEYRQLQPDLSRWK